MSVGLAILPAVEAVDGLPPELLPAALAHLLALQARVVARLAAVPTDNGHADNGDRWLTAEEVAQRTEFSVDYVYRHADKFPFTRRQGRTLRFSEAGLARWMTGRGR